VATWNIVSFNSILKKGFVDYLDSERPDILMLNETKIEASKVPKDKFPGYHSYFSSGTKKGYAGTGLLTKYEPLSVTYGIGIEEHDDEGRTITAEYEDFYLVGVYVPNSGSKLVRLDYRMKWDEDFLSYLNALKEKKASYFMWRLKCCS